ncbi:MAG TPA: hypothetical protein ENJ52_07575 [Aliiroseovarius sp.]|nr:hypothetical protein [Aliiroseovarius sp.]
MTRVIVHAGYHKTGTTSLQDFLSDNKALLAPCLRYYGKADFRQAGAHARIYAQKPFPWRLARFRRSLRRFLRDVPEGGVVVLSREAFSGGMPGHRRMGGALMTSYFGPGLRLARVIIAELRRRFGQDVDITFFYTTRAREDWIRSVYGHLLRSIRLTDDFDTFRARFPALASPEEEAQRMRGALAPVPVVTAALEAYADHREGPAAALLDLVGVPGDLRARLKPARRSNRGQDTDLQAEFLEINRRGGSRAALKAAKEKLLREARND